MRAVMLVAARGNENGSIVSSVMAGVAFAVEGDGVGFATESYAASALYTTLVSLSGALWRIRWARRFRIDPPLTLLARKSSKARIGFSRMRSSRPMHGHSIATPPEEAFAFWVPLSVPFFSNLWTA